ncbi:MAG: tRNA pseudouridine(55) synthase TruB [Actinomycetia bacterium]|nr:tRNA pseudouridine(55) synthase TruB [Actinomycetes bacterium]MCP3909370.1 tRNA pseudouridine(55) synthase TruB [Actinomycetes bacterium]
MAKRRNDGPDGLVVIDKPAGWTSHDIVAKLRGVLGTRRVGHAGTLDPDATGVLLVGVGRVTRLLRFLTAMPKTYVGEIVLGAETNTLDAAGEVTAIHDMGGVTLDQARAAAAQHLTGDILQVPPMVSALKVDGKRLHELAREGIEIERAARPVTVYSFNLDAVADEPEVLLAGVQCSSGTYVRTLAADLGTHLGGGAHLRNLRRTAIGSFGLDEADPVEEPTLLTPAEAMRDLTAVTVDAEQAAKVSHGQRLALETDEAGPWSVLGPEGDLLAVYERVDGRVKPAVVVKPAAT